MQPRRVERVHRLGTGKSKAVRAESAEDFAASLARRYQTRTGIAPQITACRPGDGAAEIL